MVCSSVTCFLATQRCWVTAPWDRLVSDQRVMVLKVPRLEWEDVWCHRVNWSRQEVVLLMIPEIWGGAEQGSVRRRSYLKGRAPVHQSAADSWAHDSVSCMNELDASFQFLRCCCFPLGSLPSALEPDGETMQITAATGSSTPISSLSCLPLSLSGQFSHHSFQSVLLSLLFRVNTVQTIEFG